MSDNENKINIGIISYGAGNVGNVCRAISKMGMDHVVLEDPHSMSDKMIDLLFLPGVGAFRPAMQNITASGWADAILSWVHDGRPLIGICLGMQLLCSSSSEDGDTRGLAVFDEDVRALEGTKKLPHMGWNTASFGDRKQDMYFVHSYAAMDTSNAYATTEVDGVNFASAIKRGSCAGFQFHPERSGPNGIDFLKREMLSLIGRKDQYDA